MSSPNTANVDRALDRLTAAIEELKASGELREELLGPKEIQQLTKIRPTHLAVMVRKGTFPQPFARLAMGPVWTREQVELWRYPMQPPERRPVTDET